MQIRILDEASIDATLDTKIKNGLCCCFPKERDTFRKQRGWHGSMPVWSVILEDPTQIVGHIGVCDRRIRVGGQAVRVAGVHNVFLLPEYRGNDLIQRLLDTVTREGKRREADFGLLFCIPVIQSVYARAGWRALNERRVTLIDTAGVEKSLPDPNITMYCSLAKAKFPDGSIHLEGNDW